MTPSNCIIIRGAIVAVLMNCLLAVPVLSHADPPEHIMPPSKELLIRNLFDSLIQKWEAGTLHFAQSSLLIDAIQKNIEALSAHRIGNKTRSEELRNIIGVSIFDNAETRFIDSLGDTSVQGEKQIVTMDVLGRLFQSKQIRQKFLLMVNNHLMPEKGVSASNSDSPICLFIAAESLLYDSVTNGIPVLEATLETQKSPVFFKIRALRAFHDNRIVPSGEAIQSIFVSTDTGLQALAWNLLSDYPSESVSFLNDYALRQFERLAGNANGFAEDSEEYRLFRSLAAFVASSEYENTLSYNQKELLHDLVFSSINVGGERESKVVSYLASRLATTNDVPSLVKMIESDVPRVSSYGALGVGRVAKPENIQKIAGRLFQLLQSDDEACRNHALFALRRGLRLPSPTSFSREDFSVFKDEIESLYNFSTR